MKIQRLEIPVRYFTNTFGRSVSYRRFLSTLQESNKLCILNTAVSQRPKQKLQHIHFPKLIDYRAASAIQEIYVRKMLDFKSQASKISHESDPLSRPTPVPPVILTFQMHPVFTLGRRGNGKSRFGDRPPEGTDALVIETLRGGQTTFHGPGQLVSYPIVDLLTHFKPFEETTGSGLTSSTKLPVRCYVSLLEKTIIQLLDTYHDVTAMTTDNTGVWVNENDKIAAIGVHVRRNVTSHGIALNVSTDIEWFKKVVACGLKDKNMVTLQMVLDKLGRNWSEESVNVNVLAKQWSRELSKSFGWDMEYIEADPKDYLKH